MIWSAALLTLSSGLAGAVPATMERNAKVHSGPGTKYHVVATLRHGTTVDVSGCSGVWCEVAWSGGQGYVAHTLIATGPAPAAVGVVPGPAYHVDDYPGFDYPGYAYEPGIAAVPRHYRRAGRWWGWRHRPGATGWAGRPNPLLTGATPGNRSPRAGGFAPGPDRSASGLAGARSTLGTGATANGMTGSIGPSAGAAASAPAMSAPAVAAPAASAPAAAPSAVNTPVTR